MASDYAIKKSNHREQIEMLDRSQKREVREKNDKHKNAMAELRGRHSTDKTSLQNNQKNQLETIKQQNDTFEQKERLSHQDKLAKQRLQAQQDYQRAANKKAQQNARLKQQTQLEKETHIQTREQYREMTQEKKAKGEKQLQQMDEESQFKVRQKRAQMQEREDTLQKGHNQEVQRIEQQGQQTTQDRKLKYQEQERLQKESHQHNLKSEKENFQNLQQRQQTQYNEKLQKEEEFYQGQLKTQQKEYSGRFEERDRWNKASFQNQDKRLTEEMFKLKREFVSTANFYEDRKQDPFYQLVDFDADFSEGEAFYEVKAKIPEHEMKNVRVHIQPEKVTLQAARKHEQEFNNENEKIGSNISQTIRQEFAFNQPAEHEAAVKTFKDGVLTVTIPKKGFYKFPV